MQLAHDLVERQADAVAFGELCDALEGAEDVCSGDEGDVVAPPVPGAALEVGQAQLPVSSRGSRARWAGGASCFARAWVSGVSAGRLDSQSWTTAALALLAHSRTTRRSPDL